MKLQLKQRLCYLEYNFSISIESTIIYFAKYFKKLFVIIIIFINNNNNIIINN